MRRNRRKFGRERDGISAVNAGGVIRISRILPPGPISRGPNGGVFLVFRKNLWLALPIIFLLHLTRESTILLTVTMACLMFRRDFPFATAVVASVLRE